MEIIVKENEEILRKLQSEILKDDESKDAFIKNTLKNMAISSSNF